MNISLPRPRTALLAVAVIALFGAGCRNPFSFKTSQQEVTGPKIATFENVTPAEATAKINFVPGSTLEIRQTFFGVGAKLGALLAGPSKEGTRQVVIERFAPREFASISWKLATKAETDTSIKAREEAQRLKKPIPEPVLADVVKTGGIDGLNLKNGPSLMVPSYWPEKGHASSLGTSGIWVSGDVYDGLDRNRIATLDFGILRPELQAMLAKATDVQSELTKLKGQMKTIENRIDVFKLEGEKDLIQVPLKVNGKDTTVEAIRAKTWFGQMVVLHNQQNPLVLKLTLDPMKAGIANAVTGSSPLSALMGYEVTSIGDAQE